MSYIKAFTFSVTSNNDLGISTPTQVAILGEYVGKYELFMY